jgi:PAS domain S-box-containing protein
MTRADELQKGKSTGRVLLYMRAGEDVSIIRKMLARMAAQGEVCTDIGDLCRRMAQEDVNAVFLTEQALSSGALPVLAEALRNQPHWSDLPVLFVASGGLESPLAVQAMQELPNVLVLDRPVRMATLAGALQMALRMRAKQRQVRDLLDERRQAEKALEKANQRLRTQTDELAAVNEQLLTEREELQRQSLELAQLKDRADRTARTMGRLARSVEENPDPVLRVSNEGRIQYRNPASFALCRQWNPEDTSRVPPAVQEIVSAAYAGTETIRREMAIGQRVYLITVAPGPPPAKRVNIFARDITERKRAEEALRESERRLHLALESARMGAWQWEVGTQHVAWSPEIYALLGYEPGRVTPSHEAFRQRVHPEDLARWEQAMRESMERCEDYACEFRVVWANGSVHWVEARGQYAYPRDDSATQTVWMRGVLSDIEQRKQAEEALRRSEQRFHQLFEDDLTGNFISTPEGKILLCNPAFAVIFGFSRAADAVGSSMADLYIDPGERAVLLERLRKESKIERLEVWRQRRDGEPIHIIENLVGRFNEQGELYEIKGYVFEDTQRKRAETALRERMKELACLYAVSRDTQEDLSVDELCRRAVEHLVPAMRFPDSTVPVIELKGRRFASGGYTEGLSHGLQAEIRVTGEVLGHLRVYYARERPFLIPEEQNLVNGVAEALSTWLERQRAEEALRELNTTLESKVTQRTAELRRRTRQLQKLTLEMSAAEDRERERLAHILHDDLQQELAAAKFHLSIAHSRARHDPAVQEITRKVDEMLKDAIGKSRSLSHELSPVVLHQGDFVEALQWLADEMQAKHGLVVHVHGRAYPPSAPIKAFLYRTAQELLFNAVKHAQAPEARVRVRQCGGSVCLSVSDRGRGFDPDELRETAGFGLLSIRERVELLGGRMKIRSAPGQGSTFFIVVPAGTQPEDRGQKTEDGRKTEEGLLSSVLRPPFSVLRVVLADDHEVVRQGLAALLGDEGTIEVVGEAANGREAVELAERLHPDVVLMDVSMPVMSGAEATRRIKQDLPRTRIVLLSMREEPEVRQKMQEVGADSYVLKTAPYKELLAAIRGEGSGSQENRPSAGLGVNS